MKGYILASMALPAVFLITGHISLQSEAQPPVVDNTPTEKLKVEPVAVKVPKKPLAAYNNNAPIVIQVEHQGFPFDLNGNFPYVVMVDNVVTTFKPEDVEAFLEKGIYRDVGTGRTRTLKKTEPIKIQ